MVMPQNPVEAAILGRRSVRGFLPDAVPQEMLAHLLDVAARAPSGTNMQPWRVIALSGAALEGFRSDLVAAVEAGEEALGSLEQPYYPQPLHEPYLSRRRKIGWDLYGLLGIARGETAKMQAHVIRNLRFFEAPVGLICTIDRRLELGSWIDYGMFLQNLAIACRGQGLESCHMAVFAEFPATIRRLLGVDAGEKIVCGMAIGREDTAAPANRLVTERVAARDFATFVGFD